MHIKKTLIKNIEDNNNYPNLEFVLVNYNSPDDLHDWASQELKQYVDSGIVRYYYTRDPQKFHASKAKNLSHRVATGEILVNLDADNFAGKDAAFYLNHLAKGNDNCFFRLRGKGFRFHDTCGRIAVFKEQFLRLGGYDESMLPFQYEDKDFVNRLNAIGYRVVLINKVNFIRSIKHNNELRGRLLGDVNYEELAKKNKAHSDENVKLGRLTANSEGFEKFMVYKNFSERGTKM
jgi:predicted glycosyltransferase involved in capsule biosynthesis